MELKKLSVPQTLDECTKRPALVLQLSNWADDLKVWGLRIFCAIVIIGLIVSISAAAVDDPYWVEKNGHYVEVTLEWSVFFVSCFTWAVYSVAEYGIFTIIETLLRALTSIVYSCEITASTALYQANKLLEENVKEED